MIPDAVRSKEKSKEATAMRCERTNGSRPWTIGTWWFGRKAKDMKQINRARESLHRKISKKNVTIDVSDRPLTLWSSDTILS